MLTRELVIDGMDSSTADVPHDVALLERVGNQDKPAFGELCQRFQQSAYNLAFSVLHDASLAEDAVQNAMLSIWVSANKYDATRGDAAAWIYGIVMNHSYKLAQSVKRRARYEEQIEMKGRTLDSTVGEAAEHNESLSVLRTHLARLPELERTLLACLFGASMTHEKIAQMTGMPRRTVTDKINQVLARLRADLGKAGVASVGTLMSSESLFKAMSVGRHCPTGLAERVMERAGSVSVRKIQRYPRRRRASLSRGSSLMPVGLAGAAIVVALAVVAAKYNPVATPATPPPAPVAAPVPTPNAPEPIADVNLKWDLSRGIPADFLQFQGTCEPSAKTGLPGIRITSANDAAFMVQHKIPARPLRIAISGYFIPGRTMSTGCFWRNGFKLMPCNITKPIQEPTLRSRRFTNEMWIFGNDIVWTYDSTVYSCTRYDAPYPGDELCLTLSRNAVFQTIEMKTVAESDIPASVRNVDAFLHSSQVRSEHRPVNDFSALPSLKARAGQ